MTDPAFSLLVLGCSGGPREQNLSSYLIRAQGETKWIACDAGSLLDGLYKAEAKGHLQGLSPLTFLHQAIHAYVISHAHLDHIAGLVLNSQVDTEKWLLGIDPTIDYLRDHIFNYRIWPNYGSEGEEPLHQYHYLRLPLEQPLSIPGTGIEITPYRLNHPGVYPSSAFLFKKGEDYLLYFGDTACDNQEPEKRMARIWQALGPLVQHKKLRGILLECSYPSARPPHLLFGHLGPEGMLQELTALEAIAGVSIKGLPVVVTHRKENLDSKTSQIATIAEELTARNHLGVRFHFPQQGDLLTF